MTASLASQVKAAVQGIKAFLDTNGSYTKEAAAAHDNIEHHWNVFVAAELLQRGVMVNDNKFLLDNINKDTVLSCVTQHAGKALLDGNNVQLPAPLLAGSSATASRVAEHLANLLSKATTTTATPHRNADDDITKAWQRCQDVQDGRLAAMLQVWMMQEGDTASAASALLIVAEGYCYRAASFQPDVPAVWKRPWDLIQQRVQLLNKSIDAININDDNDDDEAPVIPTPDAIHAVSRLRALVADKGNAARASQLALYEAECYLAAATEKSEPPQRQEPDALHVALQQSFVALYCDAMPRDGIDAVQATLEAQRLLQQVDDAALHSLSDDASRHVVRLQAELQHEQATIQQLADAEYGAAQRRAVLKAPSRESVYASVLQQYYVSNSNVVEESTDVAAAAVRNKAVVLSAPSSSLSRRRQVQAYGLLIDYVQRLRRRASAVALSSSERVQDDDGSLWSNLTVFVLPMLENWRRHRAVNMWLDSSSDPELVALVETVVLATIHVEWMHSALQSDTILLDEALLEYCATVLQSLQDTAATRLAELRAAAAANGVVKSSSDGPAEYRVRQLECATLSARAMVLLGQSLPWDRAQQHTAVTRLVLRAVDQYELYQQHSTQYGTFFWGFVVAWAGLVQAVCWDDCAAAEARRIVGQARWCREQASTQHGRRRRRHDLEHVMINIAVADVETLSMGGGLAKQAMQQFEEVVGVVPDENDVGTLIQAYCRMGQARLLFQQSPKRRIQMSDNSPASYAEQALDLTKNMASEGTVLFWRSRGAVSATIKLIKGAAQELQALSYIQDDDFNRARAVLERVVAENTSSASANTIFGSFLLQIALTQPLPQKNSLKEAQTQLLRTAKLDAGRADPFALLGYWYEFQNDQKRAIGCYVKALSLSPEHSVAGRGCGRLEASATFLNHCERAIATNASTCGWAWWYLGLHSIASGKDEDAVTFLVKALRSRDIERPDADVFSFFYVKEKQSPDPGGHEMANVLYHLAGCYRRLGRFSAAIRSYYAAIAILHDTAGSSLLSSCAQVELELGLVDEAAAHFCAVIDRATSRDDHVAVHGYGTALFSVAMQALADGKAGLAKDIIETAIDRCWAAAEKSGSIAKLVGDLYTLAASLPPSLFAAEHLQDGGRAQAEYVGQGLRFYNVANELLREQSPGDISSLATILSSKAWNFFRRACVLDSVPLANGKGLLNEARANFENAIEQDPSLADAWCGLGCAVCRDDMVLGQHAFSRASQLDPSAAEPLANLGFLLTEHGALKEAKEISSTLTQIADTHAIWINQGLLLERQAAQLLKTSNDSQPEEVSRIASVQFLVEAADSYRAALEMVWDTTALLGLALTNPVHKGSKDALRESGFLVGECVNETGEDEASHLTSLVLDAHSGALSMEGAGMLKEFLFKDNRIHVDPMVLDDIVQTVDSIDPVTNDVVAETPWLETVHELILQNDLEKAIVGVHKGITALNTGPHLPIEKKTAPNSETEEVGGSEHDAASDGASSDGASSDGLLQDAACSSIDAAHALALRYWLAQHMDAPEDSTAAAAQAAATILDLHRALLLDPTNQLAREALMLQKTLKP